MAVVATGVVVVGGMVVVVSGKVVVETEIVVVVPARLVEVEPTVEVVEGTLVLVGKCDVIVVAAVDGGYVDDMLVSPVGDGPDLTTGEVVVGDCNWGRNPAITTPLPEPSTTESITWVPDRSGSSGNVVDETPGSDATVSVASTSAAVEPSVHHSKATSTAATRTPAGIRAAATAISRPTRTLSRSR